MLYPQTIASSTDPFNPKGCWDWWGYTGAEFAFHDGAQLKAVRSMLERLASGSGEPVHAPRSDSLQLTVTDAADDAAALAWTDSAGAAAYHVFRASADSNDDFQRLTAAPLRATSFADTGLTPGRRYVYQVEALGADGGIGQSSNRVVAQTRPQPPPCDPYFSDNVTHVAHGRAWAWFGLTVARGSWDFMGLWNPRVETALYRDDDGFQVGECPPQAK